MTLQMIREGIFLEFAGSFMKNICAPWFNRRYKVLIAAATYDFLYSPEKKTLISLF